MMILAMQECSERRYSPLVRFIGGLGAAVSPSSSKSCSPQDYKLILRLCSKYKIIQSPGTNVEFSGCRGINRSDYPQL